LVNEISASGMGNRLLPLVWRVLLRSLLMAVVLAVCVSSTATTSEPMVVRAANGAAEESIRDPRWTQFTNDGESLPSNDVRVIWVEDNALWFGGGEGLSYYNGQWLTYTTIEGINTPFEEESA